MASSRRFSVPAAGALAAAVLSAPPSIARERPAPPSCASAYEDGQMRRQAGQPREARESLLQCARSSCGSLQRKCASLAQQLRSAIAWVAPVVTDAEGTPLVDVRVTMDGQPLASRLDGRELPVDPGVHDVSATARVGPWPGREVSATRKVMIVQGQRGPLTISLPASDAGPTEPPTPASASEEPSPPPAPATSATSSSGAASLTSAPIEPSPAVATRRGPSAWPFVIGGAGLLGLGAGALLTYWGKSDNDALAACSPSCAPSSVDHIRRLYLAADASFGVGGVALGVAALLFATSHPSSPEATPATAVLDVRPVRSGAVASFQGAF